MRLNRRLLEDAYPGEIRQDFAVLLTRHSHLLSAVSKALVEIGPRDPDVVSTLLEELADIREISNEQEVSLLIRHSPDALSIYQTASRDHPICRGLLLEALCAAPIEAGQKVQVLLDALDVDDSLARTLAARRLSQMSVPAEAATPKLLDLMELAVRESKAPPKAPKRLWFVKTEPGVPDRAASRKGLPWIRLADLHHQALQTLTALHPAPEMVIPRLRQAYGDPNNPWKAKAAYTRWRIDGDYQETLPI